MFEIGSKIGPYTLLSKIGRGAFGAVWLAEKRTRYTSTKFALKLPIDETINVEAVKQEASLWEHASGHPNVLPLIEADDHDGQIVIVSEYAPDGSLATWLAQHGGKAPSFEAGIEMTLGILAGLEHLHQRKIIHRDLKPDNILLQGNMPRLADFGIARVLKTTAQTRSASGTPLYMAPEAFDGKRSEKTDLWAVGVILYQLLAGRLPFAQTDMASLLAAIITREPDPLPSDVPDPVQNIIFRSLEKDPARRQSSAGEMRTELVEAAQGHSYVQDETLTVTRANTPRMAPNLNTPTSIPTLPATERVEAFQAPRGLDGSRSKWWVAGALLALLMVVATTGAYLLIARSSLGVNTTENAPSLLSTLLAVDNQYKDALRRGDPTALDQLLTDDFRITLNGKWIGDKRTLLDQVTKSKGTSFPMPEDPRLVTQTSDSATIAYEVGETMQVNANFYHERSLKQIGFTREGDRWRISRFDTQDSR